VADRIGTLLDRSGDGGEEVLIVSRGKMRTRFRRRDELDWSLRVESTDSENIVEEKPKPDPTSARRASRPRGQRVAYVRVSAADQNEARQLEAVGECDRVYVEKQSARSRADRVKLEECIRCIAPGLMETSITREGIIGNMGAPRKYPDELRERATRMALEALSDPDRSHGAIVRVAEQLGVHREALRTWVRKAQAEGQDASSVSADRDARLAQLEKENRELRRANTILKQASAFFAAELDRPQR